jgi:hypothetical protein
LLILLQLPLGFANFQLALPSIGFQPMLPTLQSQFFHLLKAFQLLNR